MRHQDFGPIADSLRRRVIEYYAESGESLDGPAGVNTLETNSGFVERRGDPLLEIVRQGTGRELDRGACACSTSAVGSGRSRPSSPRRGPWSPELT